MWEMVAETAHMPWGRRHFRGTWPFRFNDLMDRFEVLVSTTRMFVDAFIIHYTDSLLHGIRPSAVFILRIIE